MKLSFPLLTLFPPIFGQLESNDVLDNQACDMQTMTIKIQFQRPTPSCLVKRWRQSLKATQVSLEASATTSTFWRNDGSISINKVNIMSGILSNSKVNQDHEHIFISTNLMFLSSCLKHIITVPLAWLLSTYCMQGI